VLRGFLERERIYHSELFRGLYEDAARRNMRRSLERLAV
jgi:predicted metal-dependent HD superfamily phosphohydrolase